MPPPSKSRSQSARKTNSSYFLKLFSKYVSIEYAKSLIFDPTKLPIVAAGILLLELILNVLIVQRAKYTEIDWIAYMQECEGFLNGTTNYALLRGSIEIYLSTLRSPNITSFFSMPIFRFHFIFR